MRTRAKVASVLSSGAVLLVGWQLGQSAATAGVAETATTSQSTASGTGTATSGTQTGTGTGTGTGTDTGTAGASGTSDTGGSSATTTAPAASGAADGTYTGESVETRFGSVQVSVTISGGAITDVTALKLTDKEGRSVQISNQAAPILREEVLAAQSADVSIVSRATYTSDAYLQSVQSALDAAGW